MFRTKRLASSAFRVCRVRLKTRWAKGFVQLAAQARMPPHQIKKIANLVDQGV
jgi:hypothetical protein